MEQKNRSRYIRGLERMVIKCTQLYLLIIILMYGLIVSSMSSYFNNVNPSDIDSSSDLYYTVIPIIIVSILGVFSKNLYINIIDSIFRYDSNLITLKVKRLKTLSEIYVNALTILVLLFFVAFLIADSDLLLSWVIYTLIFIFYLIVGIGFIFALYEFFSRLKRKRD